MGRGHPGSESRGTWVAVLALWVEQLASAPDALPPEVSGVGPQFANLHAGNPASGERRGSAYPVLSVRGRRGEGRQGPPAAAESSLTSP